MAQCKSFSTCKTRTIILLFLLTLFITCFIFKAVLSIENGYFYSLELGNIVKLPTKKDRQAEIKQSKCRKLPDVLIIGFEKCGTITLRQFLGIHPKIFITKKRQNNEFFNAENNKTIDEFTESKPCTPEGQLRLEKITVLGLPKLVYNYIPDVKLIVIVKEPTERALSHFVHLVDRKLVSANVTDFDIYATYIFSQNTTTFNETVSRNDIRFSAGSLRYYSLYSDRIKPWIDIFGIERILILDGDQFAANPIEELNKVETFIGLQHEIRPEDFYFNTEKRFYCIKNDLESGCMLKSKGRPHPTMEQNTRKMLKDFFKPHNKIFYEMTGRTFPWDD